MSNPVPKQTIHLFNFFLHNSGLNLIWDLCTGDAQLPNLIVLSPSKLIHKILFIVKYQNIRGIHHYSLILTIFKSFYPHLDFRMLLFTSYCWATYVHICLCLGTMIGSGIFVSPGNVLKQTGRVFIHIVKLPIKM